MRGKHLNLSNKFYAQIKKIFILIIVALLVFSLCVPTKLAFASSFYSDNETNSNSLSPNMQIGSTLGYLANEQASGSFGENMTKEITEISNLAGWEPKALEDELLELVDSSFDFFDEFTFVEYLQYELIQSAMSGELSKRFVFVFFTFVQSYLDPNWVQQHHPTINQLYYNKEILKQEEIFEDTAKLIESMQTADMSKIFMTIIEIYPEIDDDIQKCLSVTGEERTIPDLVKVIRSDFKTRKINHESGIPDPPMNLQSQIFQIFQQFPKLNMTREEVNEYCWEYRNDCETDSAAGALQKGVVYIMEALVLNDLDKLKIGLIYYLCYFSSSLQYSFYNISESSTMNEMPATVDIAKCFLRSHLVFRTFSELLDVFGYDGEDYIKVIATKIMETYPIVIDEYSKAFVNDENMEAFTKKASINLIPNVNPVAKIGETTYPSLQAAFAAVNNGETITLLDNYHSFYQMTLERDNEINVTLDLNQFCIEGNSSLDYIIKVSGNKVTLNITDSSIQESGKILSTNETKKTCFMVENNGQILIDAGTYSENIEDSNFIKENFVVINNVEDETYTVCGYDQYKGKTIEELSTILQDGDSENAETIITDTVNEINNLEYDTNKTSKENRQIVDRKFDLAREAVFKDRISNFSNNKSAQIKELEDLIQEGDSEKAINVVEEALRAIKLIDYNVDLTPAKNKAVLEESANAAKDAVEKDRQENFEANKKLALPQIEELRDAQDSPDIRNLIDQAITDLKTLEYDKEISPAENQRAITENVNDLQYELYSIRLPEFNKYKEEKINSLRDMIRPEYGFIGKIIIDKAIKEIEVVSYVITDNLTTNEENINKIVVQAPNDILQLGDFDIHKASAKTGDNDIALMCLCILFLFLTSLLVARRQINKL